MAGKQKPTKIKKDESVNKVTSQAKPTKSECVRNRQELLLPALATSTNYKKTCGELGISEDQLYEWLKNPEFKGKLDSLRNDVVKKAVEEATTNLKNSMAKAVETLVKLLDREDYPAVQRAAANDILSHVQKFREIDEFETRIAMLEQRSAA